MKLILKEKSIKPKLYSMVIYDNKMIARFLWTGVAYSYDGAVSIATEKCNTVFIEEKPKENLWKPMIWQAIELEEIFNGIIDEIEIPKADPEPTNQISKNSIMQTIISKKDRGLYDEIRKAFSPAEKKLIEEGLKDETKISNC